MDLKKIEKLVGIIEKSSMLEFTVEEGDHKIHMSRRGVIGETDARMAVTTSAGAPASISVDEAIDDEVYINAPIVGTFYSSSSPEAKAYISVGDVVKAGDTVCILEAMKLMNEIEAEFDCEIEAILVSNEQKVEYGQPLFRVKPRALKENK